MGIGLLLQVYWKTEGGGWIYSDIQGGQEEGGAGQAGHQGVEKVQHYRSLTSDMIN